MNILKKIGKTKIIIGSLVLSSIIVFALCLSFKFESANITSYAESSTTKESLVQCTNLLDKNSCISGAFSFDDLVKVYAFNNKIDEKKAYIKIVELLNNPKEDERKNATYRIVASRIAVSDSYKPCLYVYCKTIEGKNDEYDYSVEKIVHAEINGKYSDVEKKFAGSIYTNLESPNRIFWTINGDFFNSGETEITFTQHNDSSFLVSYDLTYLSEHYEYCYIEHRLNLNK